MGWAQLLASRDSPAQQPCAPPSPTLQLWREKGLTYSNYYAYYYSYIAGQVKMTEQVVDQHWGSCLLERVSFQSRTFSPSPHVSVLTAVTR